jgi:hypothetical protein
VSGVYVHGELYSHRAALIKGEDCIEYAEINVEKILESSTYLFVQIVDREGKRAWSAPYYIKGEDKSDV